MKEHRSKHKSTQAAKIVAIAGSGSHHEFHADKADRLAGKQEDPVPEDKKAEHRTAAILVGGDEKNLGGDEGSADHTTKGYYGPYMGKIDSGGKA